jgi:hypothetical protein
MVVASLAASLLTSCDSASSPPREVPLEEIEAQVGEVVCGPQFECGCDNGTFYESAAMCRDVAAALANDVRQTASENGLTWDPTCLGAQLDLIADAGCSATFGDEAQPDDDAECVPPCNILHGDRTLGASCEYAGSNASNCAQGLSCNGSLCIDPCAEDGTPNGAAGLGQSCFDLPCEEGLQCDWENDRCIALPEVGQPCPFGSCAEGGFCELEDPSDPTTQLLCKAPYGFGEPCRGHSQCETGFCPAGFCDDLPEEGESCRGTFACAPGFDCVEEVCQPGAPAVCSIPVPLPGL